MPHATHKYSITRKDLLWTQIHLLVRNRILLVFLIVGVTCTALVTVRGPEMAAIPTFAKVLFVLFFDVVLVGIISTVGLFFLWLVILARKGQGVLGEHTIEVTDSGLVERTDFNETVHRWKGFHKLVRTRGYLYLWVTDSLIHTVPMRSFASEDAAEAFQYAIERCRALG